MDRCALSDEFCTSFGYEDGVANRYRQCPPDSHCFEYSASGIEFGKRTTLYGCLEYPNSCSTFEQVGLELGANTHWCRIISHDIEIDGIFEKSL